MYIVGFNPVEAIQIYIFFSNTHSLQTDTIVLVINIVIICSFQFYLC